jgi:hypothetical protein
MAEWQARQQMNAFQRNQQYIAGLANQQYGLYDGLLNAANRPPPSKAYAMPNRNCQGCGAPMRPHRDCSYCGGPA